MGISNVYCFPTLLDIYYYDKCTNFLICFRKRQVFAERKTETIERQPGQFEETIVDVRRRPGGTAIEKEEIIRQRGFETFGE